MGSAAVTLVANGERGRRAVLQSEAEAGLEAAGGCAAGRWLGARGWEREGRHSPSFLVNYTLPLPLSLSFFF